MTDTIHERVSRERIAHDEDDVLGRSAELKGRFPLITKYKGFKELHKRIDDAMATSFGLTVLDYGCGKGEDAMGFLANGANLIGIDISSAYIDQCREKAISLNFPEDKYSFHVMDAHKLEFDDDTFDLIIGNGILHHLDIGVAFNELHRVLKPGGRLVFKEPLGSNPLLKLFRLLTPSARTADERPLFRSDLSSMLDEKRWEANKSHYCGLVEAPVAIVASLMRLKEDSVALAVAAKFEKGLNQIAVLKPFNQYILFDLVKR